MCVTDAFSKFAKLIAIPDQCAETVAEALYSRWLCRYSLQLGIKLDLGMFFCNEVVDKLLMLLKIKKKTNTIYHPQTNAQVEVVNKTIAQYLKTQVDINILNWELYLAPMAFSYNTSFCQTISSAPFKVMYVIDASNPHFGPKQLYGEDLPTELYQKMQVCHNIAKN
jgi:hypothetical protein